LTKEEVRTLLEARQYDRLRRLAEENREVIEYLYAFLSTRDGVLRWRAIEGLGYVTGGLSQRDPAVGREVIGRLFRFLDEEPDGSGWSAPEAIGEIIRHRPEMFGEFVPRLIALFGSNQQLRRGVIWALGRIGKREPALVAPALPALISALQEPDPEIRGFAAWSLGEIAAQEAASALGALRTDHETVTIYEAGKLWQRTVGAVALDALANIRARA
jgi:HEAT repeat protein